MAVSFKKPEIHNCQECGKDIQSEVWYIVHRLERPLLWARCKDYTIHQVRCPSGHINNKEAPILLFDPGLKYAIFSPPFFGDVAQADALGELLMQILNATLSPQDKEHFLGRREYVSRELLPFRLLSPQLNLHDFAPGADPTDELAELYKQLQESNIDDLKKLIAGGIKLPAVEAAFRYELATALTQQGEEAPQNLEEAILEYYRTLIFYNQDQFPHRWATIQSQLAIAFRNRKVGNPGENVRMAIECSERALEVFDLDRYPEDYAIVHSNIAHTLLDGKKLDSAFTDRAIDSFQAVLSVYTLQTYPKEWAQAQLNLGAAYMERSAAGDPEKASAAFALALSGYTLIGDQHLEALAKMNMGMALDRLSGKQAAGQKITAIKTLRAAHQELKVKSSSWEANAMNYNLGITLAHSGHAKDISEAVDLLEQAYQFYLTRGEANYVQECLEELVRAYSLWLRLHPEDQQLYDLCLRIHRTLQGEQNSEEVGILYHQISLAFFTNPSIPDEERVELAKQAAEKALLILRYKHQAEARAKALANLGVIYMHRSTKSLQAEKARAFSCFEAALRIMNTLDPTPERNTIIGEIYTYKTIAERETD